jgi:hypothetical protein
VGGPNPCNPNPGHTTRITACFLLSQYVFSKDDGAWSNTKRCEHGSGQSMSDFFLNTVGTFCYLKIGRFFLRRVMDLHYTGATFDAVLLYSLFSLFLSFLVGAGIVDYFTAMSLRFSFKDKWQVIFLAQ